MALIYVILPMMTDLLIDTNILIYAYDRESAFHDSSRTLIENPDFNLFVTTKNISEFFAVCSKLKIPLSSTFNFYSEIKSNSFVLLDRKSTRLNSSHVKISYAVFCLKKKNDGRTNKKE